MKIIIKSFLHTLFRFKFSTWKRNTNDPNLAINCVRSVVRAVLQIISSVITIVTVGFYDPSFGNKFIIETMERIRNNK